jgi:hypothetical protein
MQSIRNFGISMPNEIVRKIDIDRGDVPRSKYLLRILEKMYDTADDRYMDNVERNQSRDLRDRNGIETPDDHANPSVHRRRFPHEP